MASVQSAARIFGLRLQAIERPIPLVAATARRLFASGVNRVRPHGWTLADDGDLYTLPLGSRAVETGRVGR